MLFSQIPKQGVHPPGSGPQCHCTQDYCGVCLRPDLGTQCIRAGLSEYYGYCAFCWYEHQPEGLEF